jgi:hypothetical protein
MALTVNNIADSSKLYQATLSFTVLICQIEGINIESLVTVGYNGIVMWPFKRKAGKNIPSRPLCTYCGSTNTKMVISSETEQPDHIRTWRGQRYIACKCRDCGKEFYIEETMQDIEELFSSNESFLADEDELLAAEEELKRQTDEEDDRRYR